MALATTGEGGILQGRLPIDESPGAKKTDPYTSHVSAEAAMIDKVKLAAKQAVAWTYVARNPGTTAHDVDRAFRKDVHTILGVEIEDHVFLARSISKMKKAGLIIAYGHVVQEGGAARMQLWPGPIKCQNCGCEDPKEHQFGRSNFSPNWYISCLRCKVTRKRTARLYPLDHETIRAAVFGKKGR